jgi:hypothetical protein
MTANRLRNILARFDALVDDIHATNRGRLSLSARERQYWQNGRKGVAGCCNEKVKALAFVARHGSIFPVAGFLEVLECYALKLRLAIGF